MPACLVKKGETSFSLQAGSGRSRPRGLHHALPGGQIALRRDVSVDVDVVEVFRLSSGLQALQLGVEMGAHPSHMIDGESHAGRRAPRRGFVRSCCGKRLLGGGGDARACVVAAIAYEEGLRARQRQRANASVAVIAARSHQNRAELTPVSLRHHVAAPSLPCP